MRKLVLAAVAMLVMSFVAAPSAVAQETKEKKEMKEMAKKSHWMKGTMTAPGGEAVEVAYAVEMGEHGPMGWIVSDGDDGEKVKMEMKDLSMDGDYVNYKWSPPDEASLVITCSLKKQADGGFAGDCQDNQEEGRTGQMTIAPMEGMNPCAAGMNPCAAMNPCSG
jgi:hypothetical protein